MAGQYSSLVQQMNQMASVNSETANKPVSPMVQKMNEMAGLSEFKPARFAGEQLGKGGLQLSDMLKFLGANQAAKLADMGMSPMEIEEVLGKGHETAAIEHAEELGLNTQPENTPGKRIAGQALRALPAAILPVMGGAGVLGSLGMMGASGAASGALQEAGVPALPADILSGMGVASMPGIGRTLTKTAKNIWNPATAALPKLSKAEQDVARYIQESVGTENLPEVLERIKAHTAYKSGYQPTTAEIANNPALAIIHRGEEGIPTSGISEKMGKGADILNERLASMTGEAPEAAVSEAIAKRLNMLEREKEHAIQAVGRRAHPEEGGAKIREAVESELGKHKQVRHAETHPKYEEVRNIQDPMNPKHLKYFIKKEKDKVTGTLEKDLDGMMKLISPKLTPQERAYNRSYHKKIDSLKEQGYSQKAIDKAMEGAEPPKSTYPTTAKVSALRTEINNKITKFEQSEPARANQMRKLKTALDKDLETIPMQKEADILYSEYSKPVNEIEKHPTLKKMLKEERGQEQLTDSRVANLFLKSGKESLDDARALVSTVGHRPDTIKSVKEVMNDYAIQYITDPKTGKILPHKLNQLKSNHPGIEMIYPELFQTKLKNAGNAQINANRYYRDSAAKAAVEYNEHLAEYTGKTGPRLANEIFTHDSDKNMGNLIKSISHDPEAMEAARRLSIDKFYRSIQNASKEGNYQTLSFDKMRKFLNSHRKAIKKVLTKDQMEFVDEFEQIMHGKNVAATAGTEKGSPTAQRTRTHEAFKSKTASGWVPTKAGRFLFKKWADAHENKRLEILHKLLLDKDYAVKLMNHQFKNETEFNSFMNEILKTQTSAILSRRPEGEENE